jgi:hypothetical protein
VRQHPIVSRDEWLIARRALRAREKEATRLRDKVNQEHSALPWVRIEKQYGFDTPAGRRSLPEQLAKGHVSHNFPGIEAARAHDELPCLGAFAKAASDAAGPGPCDAAIVEAVRSLAYRAQGD